MNNLLLSVILFICGTVLCCICSGLIFSKKVDSETNSITNNILPSQDQPNIVNPSLPLPASCSTSNTVGLCYPDPNTCPPTTWPGKLLFKSYSTNICYYVTQADMDKNIQAVRHWNGDPVIVKPTYDTNNIDSDPTATKYLYYTKNDLRIFNISSTPPPAKEYPTDQSTVLIGAEYNDVSETAFSLDPSKYPNVLLSQGAPIMYDSSYPTSNYFGTLI